MRVCGNWWRSQLAVYVLAAGLAGCQSQVRWEDYNPFQKQPSYQEPYHDAGPPPSTREEKGVGLEPKPNKSVKPKKSVVISKPQVEPEQPLPAEPILPECASPLCIASCDRAIAPELRPKWCSSFKEPR